MNNEIKLVIDNNILSEYNKHYFKLHPKAKKPPIEKPRHPSINQWMIMKRPQMNNTKQKWKDFMMWMVEYHGYKNLNIEKCEMKITTYFDINRRHDVDNTVPKFILDGLAESKFIADDDSKHLISLTLEVGVDKENPRTEIYVSIKE